MTAGSWIIDTDVDARTTMGRMARLCRKAMTDPRVIYAANQVASIVPARDVTGQIDAISQFVNCSFVFVPNPIGTQTIRPPGWTGNALAPGMLEDIEARGITQGACDDAAVLIATLGMANGIPARFRALAFWIDQGDGQLIDPFTHVICDLCNGPAWLELDVTRPADMTRPNAADIARTLIVDV